MKRSHFAAFLLGVCVPLLMGAAITFASAVIPISAATDASVLCYQHDRAANTWSVSAPVCPVLDPTIVSGFSSPGCTSLTASISAPSGAVLTDLKAKFKLLVQLNPGACGSNPCPSAD